MFILTETVIRIVVTVTKQFVPDLGHKELKSAILKINISLRKNWYSLPGLIFSLLDAFILLLANLLIIIFMITTIVLYKLDLKNRYMQLIHVHHTVIL